jgi:hypothetical protein
MKNIQQAAQEISEYMNETPTFGEVVENGISYKTAVFVAFNRTLTVYEAASGCFAETSFANGGSVLEEIGNDAASCAAVSAYRQGCI